VVGGGEGQLQPGSKGMKESDFAARHAVRRPGIGDFNVRVGILGGKGVINKCSCGSGAKLAFQPRFYPPIHFGPAFRIALSPPPFPLYGAILRWSGCWAAGHLRMLPWPSPSRQGRATPSNLSIREC
jgi:hypothetical protein